jgi:hypothetical protein
MRDLAMRGALVGLLLSVLAAGEVPEALATARRELVDHLGALAEWCQKSELYLDRDHAYELVLRFDPDHRDARKWLKYVRRGGAWVRLTAYSPPKNRNAKAEPESRERRDAVARKFAEDVLSALDKDGPAWPPDVRETAVEDVLAVDPDNARAHELNGEVQQDGHWVKAEIVAAGARRRELAQAAKDALAGVPEPSRVEIGDDAKLGVAWTDAVETETWRVVATTGLDEAKRAAVIATATIPLFEACFKTPVKPREGQVYYVMAKQADFQAVLTNHPRCKPDFRKFAFEVASAWLPRTGILLAYSAQASTRLEFAARQPLAALLLRAFGITPRQGWAYEGIGLYLTELLTGTHTTYTVHPTGYALDDQHGKTDLWGKIQAPDSDWFAVARGLVQEKKNPELIDLMSKDVNTMDAADLIFSYVLGAYLLEACPDKAPELLRAVGEKKVPFHEAVPKVLGIDVHTLQEHLLLWIEGRR